MRVECDFSKMRRVPNPVLRKKYGDGKLPDDVDVRWILIGDTLLAGTEEQISKVKCPVCRDMLQYRYLPHKRKIEMSCVSCGAIERYSLANAIPKFVEYATV